jgi:hypothetical protein
LLIPEAWNLLGQADANADADTALHCRHRITWTLKGKAHACGIFGRQGRQDSTGTFDQSTACRWPSGCFAWFDQQLTGRAARTRAWGCKRGWSRKPCVHASATKSASRPCLVHRFGEQNTVPDHCSFFIFIW